MRVHPLLTRAHEIAALYSVQPSDHGFSVWRFFAWEHEFCGWRIVGRYFSTRQEAEQDVLKRLGLETIGMSNLSAPHFHNEEAAYAYVEARIWPDGPICPHCGGVDRIGKMGGKSTRIGTYKCYQCRKPFTVKVGTIFEKSHVPMRVWLQAIYLMAASKKGFSSNQMARTLGVDIKTGWFIEHRIREAMRDGELAPFGGAGGFVEVDETFIGTDKDSPSAKAGRVHHAYHHKMKVLTLVDRTSGRARSQVVDTLTVQELIPIIEANVLAESHMVTDEAKHYRELGWSFDAHSAVAHGAGQYVDVSRPHIHTNTVEGYYSIFKRGMRGVYQHCSKRHLHRYAAEFDFRYSNRVALGVNDIERADRVLAGAVGKRLTYAATGGAQEA